MPAPAAARALVFVALLQKDRALFPVADPREFWQRAQDRNRATAALYDRQVPQAGWPHTALLLC
jgi:hypothetical protein